MKLAQLIDETSKEICAQEGDELISILEMVSYLEGMETENVFIVNAGEIIYAHKYWQFR